MKQSEFVLKKLESGSVGLVTDAGMPGISDPGSFLVNLVRENNYDVVVIPGPSSLTASIALSGFKPNSWLFAGFFPKDTSKRKEVIKAYMDSKGHLIFFESAKRLCETLLWIKANFEINPKVCVLREITKVYEEVNCFELFSVEDKAGLSTVKGEIVVALESIDLAEDNERFYELAADLIRLGVEPSNLSKLFAKHIWINKNWLYKKLLQNKQ